MARPIKDGVDYFPKDANFYSNDKIRILKSEFGAKGMYLLDYLLCDLYGKKGYYIDWNEDKCYLVSDGAGCGCDFRFVQEFISGCVRRSFFDEGVFTKFGVLTSESIQRRYIRMLNNRDKIILIREYLLLDMSSADDIPTGVLSKVAFKNQTSNGNPDKSNGNPDKSNGNTLKEKESKENTPPNPLRGKDRDFARFWEVYPKKTAKAYARKAFDKVKVSIDVLISAIEKQKTSLQWTKDGGQYIPNPATWLNQGRWEDELSPSEMKPKYM